MLCVSHDGLRSPITIGEDTSETSVYTRVPTTNTATSDHVKSWPATDRVSGGYQTHSDHPVSGGRFGNVPPFRGEEDCGSTPSAHPENGGRGGPVRTPPFLPAICHVMEASF